MRSHDPPLWRWFVLPVAGVVALLIAGWLFVRWVDWSMTGIHVYEDAGEARHLAERHGLTMHEHDRIEYGEMQSSFPDSGAYLVVTVQTPADRERLLADSRLACGPQLPVTGTDVRSSDNHGPGPTATLVRCQHDEPGRGGLAASYDPLAPDHGTRLYVSSYDE